MTNSIESVYGMIFGSGSSNDNAANTKKADLAQVAEACKIIEKDWANQCHGFGRETADQLTAVLTFYRGIKNLGYVEETPIRKHTNGNANSNHVCNM